MAENIPLPVGADGDVLLAGDGDVLITQDRVVLIAQDQIDLDASWMLENCNGLGTDRSKDELEPQKRGERPRPL